MLSDYRCNGSVYLALGYTDLRKGVDGLCSLLQVHYGMTVKENDLFLFCGRRNDRIKGLLWEGDGFLMVYKRLEKGRFQWPRNREELTAITEEQYGFLMRGWTVFPPQIPKRRRAPKNV